MFDAPVLLGEVRCTIKAVQCKDIVAILCPEMLKGEKKDTVYSDARGLEVVQHHTPPYQVVWVWSCEEQLCAMTIQLSYTYISPSSAVIHTYGKLHIGLA